MVVAAMTSPDGRYSLNRKVADDDAVDGAADARDVPTSSIPPIAKTTIKTIRIMMYLPKASTVLADLQHVGRYQVDPISSGEPCITRSRVTPRLLSPAGYHRLASAYHWPSWVRGFRVRIATRPAMAAS
jgi:hypothetical protein